MPVTLPSFPTSPAMLSAGSPGPVPTSRTLQPSVIVVSAMRASVTGENMIRMMSRYLSQYGADFLHRLSRLSLSMDIRNSFRLFVKHLMHKRNRDRAFANSGCHALNVAGANVADREYSRQTDLKQIKQTGKQPMRR